MARIPLYQKAETEMLRRINSGQWESGMRLGNEFELADEFGVSQGTMRRALMTLEAQGYLSRKPGRGTIVASPDTRVPKAANDMPRRSGSLIGPVGAKPDFAIHRSKLSAAEATGEDLALFGEGSLHVLERMWKRGSTRACVEELFIPESAVRSPSEEGPTDLEPYMAVQGVKVAQIEDNVSTRVTTMGESVALSCDRHTALLLITRIARDASGHVVARQALKIADPEIAYHAA